MDAFRWADAYKLIIYELTKTKHFINVGVRYLVQHPQATPPWR
jgi:hypothetical protein